MTAGEFVTKRRVAWRPSALRLLRERACAQYARRAVAGRIDGVRIAFPEIEVSLGVRVTVRSRRLEGRALMDMLYEREMWDNAVEMGLIALKTLQSARVNSARLALFGQAYQPIRAAEVLLKELFGSPLISPVERRTLKGLLAPYIRDHGGEQVLVHGDLHPSHLIVDLAARSLGFIDLEALRTGKAATNFAQLWIGFHFADPSLGERLYRGYQAEFPALVTPRFDADVRAEMALRSYSHLEEGRRGANQELEAKAGLLLARLLSDASFEAICCGE